MLSAQQRPAPTGTPEWPAVNAAFKWRWHNQKNSFCLMTENNLLFGSCWLELISTVFLHMLHLNNRNVNLKRLKKRLASVGTGNFRHTVNAAQCAYVWKQTTWRRLCGTFSKFLKKTGRLLFVTTVKSSTSFNTWNLISHLKHRKHMRRPGLLKTLAT